MIEKCSPLALDLLPLLREGFFVSGVVLELYMLGAEGRNNNNNILTFFAFQTLKK